MINFQKQVFNLVKKIPKGRVTTYKILAEKLDNKNLARAVGNALNKNPQLIKVPCHRVINSDGYIGGYKLGQAKKLKLLSKEGVIFKNNKIINFDLYKFYL
ncbi:MGMT family protein [Candidatus Falkowbacteria bacterium]|nr:MGMT family protein [Candidatus Falkowbacteria bacterium]